jgi:nucleotide-binding universal stress UspA family protein
MGVSNRFDPDAAIDQVALYWLNLSGGNPPPLTIRVLGRDRDIKLDIAGGSQIPRVFDRTAPEQILTDLRESWRGVKRLLLAYDGSPLSCDFLDTVLSFLDPAIAVTLIDVAEPSAPGNATALEANEIVQLGLTRARELGREVEMLVATGDPGPQIVQAATDGKFDAIFMSLRGEYRKRDTMVMAPTTSYVLQHAPCRVILGFPPKSIKPQNEAATATATPENA